MGKNILSFLLVWVCVFGVYSGLSQATLADKLELLKLAGKALLVTIVATAVIIGIVILF